MNQNNNSFFAPSQTPKTPWYLQPDVKAPAGYNPYTDEKSVFTEILEENPNLFGGTEKNDYESDATFEQRKLNEDSYTKRIAESKLKSALTSVAFWLLLTLLMMNSFSSAVVALNGLISDAVYSILYYVHLVLTYVAFFPAVFFIASVGKKIKTYTFFRKPVASKFYILRWTVIIFGVTHAVAVIFNLIFTLLNELGLHTNELAYPTFETLPENILYFVAVVICAPVFEEILFRGFILSKLNRFGSWFAIISSALLFGLFHQNHEQLFFTTAFGVLTGFVVIRTKSIIPSVIAHVALNGYSYFLSLAQSFTVSNGTALAGDFSIDGPMAAIVATGILTVLVYALMLVGIVMLVAEIITNKSQFSLGKSDCKLFTSDKAKIFISSPSMILLLIILITNLITVSFIDLNEISSMLDSIYSA